MKGVSRAQRELAEQLFREKQERRKRLAALPIEEKIRILVEMQKLSNDIREKTGRKPLPVWVIEPSDEQALGARFLTVCSQMLLGPRGPLVAERVSHDLGLSFLRNEFLHIKRRWRPAFQAFLNSTPQRLDPGLPFLKQT
jgi:hypothetical protein